GRVVVASWRTPVQGILHWLGGVGVLALVGGQIGEQQRPWVVRAGIAQVAAFGVVQQDLGPREGDLIGARGADAGGAALERRCLPKAVIRDKGVAVGIRTQS